jgi:hypothetical protein
MNYQDNKSNVPMAIVDGFDDSDSSGRDSIVKGTKIKFSLEYEWLTAGDEKIDPKRKFLVIELIKVEQKWLPDQKWPAETIIRAADEKFRNMEALNNAAPRTEWQMKFGKLTGPWQASQVAYLLDPRTLEIFTYIVPTDNKGGSRAIRDLKEGTRLARKVRGGNRFPLVTLADTYMPTQYGGRQRPCFKIEDYPPLGQAPAQLEREEIKQIEVKSVKRTPPWESEDDSEPDVSGGYDE